MASLSVVLTCYGRDLKLSLETFKLFFNVLIPSALLFTIISVGT